MQRTLTTTPRFFHVNGFRKSADGKFLWPGFSENMRVLKWIVDRVNGRALGQETPIGWTPHYDDMQWEGLDFSEAQFDTLQQVDRAAWKQEVTGHEELFLAARPFPPGDDLRAGTADLPLVDCRRLSRAAGEAARCRACDDDVRCAAVFTVRG